MKKENIMIIASIALLAALTPVALLLVHSQAGMTASLVVFLGVDPLLSAAAGATAGREIKKRWFVPLCCAAVYYASALLTFRYDNAFALYAAFYLAVSMVAMLITAGVRRFRAGKENKNPDVPFMVRHRGAVRFLFYSAIIAGCAVVVALLSVLTVFDSVAQSVLAIWMLAAAAGLMIINAVWTRQLSKALDALAPILHSDPDRYINSVNDLLGEKEAASLQNVRQINLSAAYQAKHDYRASQECLARVKVRKLKPRHACIYWANKASAHFQLGEWEEGCAIMRAQRRRFARFSKTASPGDRIAALRIYELIARGRREEARTMLAVSRHRLLTPDLREELVGLERLLQEDKRTK